VAGVHGMPPRALAVMLLVISMSVAVAAIPLAAERRNQLFVQ